ncbi:SIMPL domain-containing protein [Zhouia sp. PK063]|uniref:SIMPL domain-containing protein n=1 Tax=Zhouia sp. PK063 TaxID=3373602 RepID=UPI0037B84916
MKKLMMIAFIAILGFQAKAQTTTTMQTQPTVSVTGEGKVQITPDQVVINVRAENEGQTAAEVKAANDKAVANVLAFLKKMKVDSKDVKTEYLRLNKNYDYNVKEYKYTANQSISILVRNLDQYEQIMEGLVASGINRIEDINFKSSEMDKYEAQARIKAVKDAKEKAEAYANVLGQKVGKAITISEAGHTATPIPVAFKTMAVNSNESSDATIAIGQLEVSATINIAFELY